MTIFLDIGPVPGGVGLLAAAALFLVLAAAAFIAFKVLKRSVKMAFRMVIVAAILLIAIVGGISIWWLLGERSTKPDPRPRSTQSK